VLAALAGSCRRPTTWLQSRMFERRLVLEPCGRAAKDGGLAQNYNEECPNGAICHKTPITLLNHVSAASPPS
jgi:hypothetical protein